MKLNFKSLINLFTGKKRPERSIRPSLNNLDTKLESYLDFDNGFFIEAGANDGYRQSNTFYLASKRGWRGVLVEGIPELYKKCVVERKESVVVNCALVAQDYPHPTVQMHYANLMSVVDGAFKTKEKQEEHIQAGIDVQRLKSTYEVSVVARTLESVLDQVKDLEQIDFFSLDVEGYELEVLDGLNIEKYTPRFILVETWLFEDVNQLLTSYGYEMLDKLSQHDYLYHKP